MERLTAALKALRHSKTALPKIESLPKPKRVFRQANKAASLRISLFDSGSGIDSDPGVETLKFLFVASG
jgi:hypothetical protein